MSPTCVTESGNVHVEGGAPMFVVKSFNISPDHVHSDDSFTLSGYIGTEAGRYSGTIGCRLRSDMSADVVAESTDEIAVNISPTLDRYYTFRFGAMPEGEYRAVAFDKTSSEDLVELGTVSVRDISIDITNVNVTADPMAHRDFKIDSDITVSEPLWDYVTVRCVDATDGYVEYYDHFKYVSLHSLSADVPTAVTFEFRGRDFDVEGGDYYIEFIVGDIWSDCENLPSVYRYGPLAIAEFVCDPLLIGMPSFTESVPAYTLQAGLDYTVRIPVRKIGEGSASIYAKICSAIDDAEIYSTYLNTSSASGTEEVLETRWYRYDAGFRGDAYLVVESFDYDYSYAPLSPLEYNRVPVVITDESGINDVVGGSSSVRYNPGSRSIVVLGAKEGEEVTLFDAAGRELIRTVASADTFDISLAGIPAGVYIVMAGGKVYKINCR